MIECGAVIVWQREGAVFTDNQYQRVHRWQFDGGIEVPASSSPDIVPLPLSTAAAVDPEEAFVASLASCHMLSFLSLAARSGFVVDSYRDEAVGVLGRDSNGKVAIVRVTLRPSVQFLGPEIPLEADILALHHEAHEQCFIASSVKTDVHCEPVDPLRQSEAIA